MRAKGEGSIYYDPKADRWRGQADIGTDGRGRRRRTKVTGRTKQEAAEKLRARQAAIRAGDRAPVTMTVGDLATQWLEATTPTTSQRNADYLRWITTRATDHLGAHRLTELRIVDVEAALVALETEGLNRTSLGRVRGNLSRILDWGQDRELIGRNVAKRATIPKAKEPAKGRSLTGDELAKLLDAVADHRMNALWQVMVGCALRPAEAAGLTWQDVDLDTGTLYVTQVLKWTGATPRLGKVKTARSRRTLAIPAPVVEALRAHRRQSVTERLALRWSDDWDALVFRSEAGTPVSPSTMRRLLDRATRRAGIGHVRPYDLRHTCASIMADTGARLEDIADYLGHEGTEMARHVYVHRLTDRVDTAAVPLARAIGNR